MARVTIGLVGEDEVIPATSLGSGKLGRISRCEDREREGDIVLMTRAGMVNITRADVYATEATASVFVEPLPPDVVVRLHNE